jgi:hypothetical protein
MRVDPVQPQREHSFPVRFLMSAIRAELGPFFYRYAKAGEL